MTVAGAACGKEKEGGQERNPKETLSTIGPGISAGRFACRFESHRSKG